MTALFQEMLNVIRNGQDNLTIFEELEEDSDILSCRDANGFTLLHRAVQRGKINIIEILLNKGADLKARCRWRSTPLHEAASVGRASVVKVLLNYGAGVTVFTDWGESPLITAVANRKYQVAELLLQYGPYLYNKDMVKSYVDRDRFGKPVLHVIASRRQEYELDKKLAQLFLSYGASLELTWQGLTPLQIAVMYDKVLLTELFLEYGAKVNIVDTTGKTPLECAITNKNYEIENLLLRYGARKSNLSEEELAVHSTSFEKIPFRKKEDEFKDLSEKIISL